MTIYSSHKMYAQFCRNKTATSNGLTSTDLKSTNGSGLVYFFAHSIIFRIRLLRFQLVFEVVLLFAPFSPLHKSDVSFHSCIHWIVGVFFFFVAFVLYGSYRIFGASFRCYTAVSDAGCLPHIHTNIWCAGSLPFDGDPHGSQ